LPPEWFGGGTVFLSDLNGDGYGDIAHTGIGINPQLNLQESRVWILSGRDGSTLRYDAPPSIEYWFQGIAAAGDWDHDHVQDYAVARFALNAPYGPNIVEVRSGANGTPLMQVSGPFGHQFGVYFASDLDVDGDGKGDLVVGAPRERPPGSRNGVVHVYDHFGQELYSVTIPFWGLGTFGGDLDGDGCDEFIIGSGDEDNRGAALVYSGRTGTLLVAGVGEPFDGIGSGSNSGCSDVDGDGVRDFVSSTGTIFPLASLVRVFSGSTGRQIYAWNRGPGRTGYGQQLAVGDLDVDGIDDLLIAYVYSCGCSLCVGDEWRSLRDGSIVTTICRPTPMSSATGFGVGVAIGPPQPGDAFPVIAVTEYLNQFGAECGALHLFRAAPQSVAELGPGCIGTLGAEPRLGFTAYPTFARAHVSHAPAGSTAFLLLGVNATTPPVSLHLGLEPFGLAGCELHVAVQITAAVTTGGDGTRRGYAFVDLPLPDAASQGTISLSGQWLVLGRGNRFPGALSRAISWSH
jgi:hypothetical protein